MKKHFKLMGQILLVVFALYGMFAFASQIISPNEAALADSSHASEVLEAATQRAVAQEAVPTPRAPEDLKGGLFVNLTTDDLDRAAMAIGFATKVRKNTGKPVTIFMNTQGVRLVDINIPQNVHKSGNTMHQMLQMFMDEGGVALVCPVCMKNVGGLSEGEILPDVIIGTPEYTWSAMFAEDVTVVSY